MIERRGGCIHEAYAMCLKHQGGEIWRVCKQNELGVKYLQHYFIPPEADGESLALNGSENGYFACEQLTVAQVRELGSRVSPFEVKA